MGDSDVLDPGGLTFSEAQAYEPLPQQIQLGQVSEEFRNYIWSILYEYIRIHCENYRSAKNDSWYSICKYFHVFFVNDPVDTFPDKGNWYYDGAWKPYILRYKPLFLQELSFNKLFDAIQVVMRHPECPHEFVATVSGIFKICRLSYMIDREIKTIIPAVTKQEGQALLGAMRELRSAGLGGAAEHLRKAVDAINGGHWGDSVRESIHAVESVARLLDPDASRTLRPALDSLEQRGGLHPALRGAFNNLYGYTSNEQGIRHALLDNTQAKVGQDEAMFMLGACASFASYLWRKHQAG